MARVRIDPSSRLPVPGSARAARAEELPFHAPPLAAPAYVELAARSHFSFLQGASSPEALVRRAAELGYTSVALADRDGLYGVVRAHQEAKKLGIALVVGAEVTVRAAEGPLAGEPGAEPVVTVVLLVENHAGYTNLCRLLTLGHARHEKGRARKRHEGVPRNNCCTLYPSDMSQASEGLWAIVPPELPAGALALFRLAFSSRLSIGVHRHGTGFDGPREARARELARRFAVDLVAENRVRYATPREKPLYDVMQCIREGVRLDEAGRLLEPNARACLESPARMAERFADEPSWLARTLEIAEACRFSMGELRYDFPSHVDEPAHPGETPDEALRRLTYEGARGRWGAVPPAVEAQIERELRIIATLKVAPYFLSVHTLVRMARKRDILCQGRGSAANSAVCYCLGVTAVDPSRSSLLFERFLSVERAEPPDIDVDFEHERREELIRDIYALYGRDRAAMVSEVVTYRGRSALREVAKVFGLSAEEQGRLARMRDHWGGGGEITGETLRERGFDPESERLQRVLELAVALEDAPRHLSIHVGGFVLSSTPLVQIAPIEPATMKGRTIIPWDKDDLDALGFFKVDVLALGMLTAIRKALEMAAPDDPRLHAASAIDALAKIPAECPEVYEALQRADTVGVFQIESRAQMAMLPRLRPERFYDLVVEVAIVRPGPIQGGMVHPYLRRRRGEEAVTLPHPSLDSILERTLGVPLFQEQVMQIAIVGAGYTGGEADQLRRDMAAWRRNGKLEHHREKLLRGFRERGIAEEFGERLFAQIQGFGEYGFPESHAASFALLVYASAWLKVHHPAAFAAALVNAQPMGFYSPLSILADAQRHGVVQHPIDVNESRWDLTLVRPSDEQGGGGSPEIRLGFRLVSGLSEAVVDRLVAARRERPFGSVAEVRERARLTQRDLTLLAEAGAFDRLAGHRRQALWEAREPSDGPLFREVVHAPRVTEWLAPASPSEQLLLDFARTGTSTRAHPMALLRDRLPPGVLGSQGLAREAHGARVQVAGIVICRQRPMTASGVTFITMEDEHGFLNLVLWKTVAERQAKVVNGSTALVVEGKVEREGSVLYVVVDRAWPLGRGQGLASMSRDFR
jgi:error-prone DNA polymerase